MAPESTPLRLGATWTQHLCSAWILRSLLVSAAPVLDTTRPSPSFPLSTLLFWVEFGCLMNSASLSTFCGRKVSADRRQSRYSPGSANAATHDAAIAIARVGRGAGALGARGAKKRHPRLGRGALQKFGGAEIQNSHSASRSRTHNFLLE